MFSRFFKDTAPTNPDTNIKTHTPPDRLDLGKKFDLAEHEERTLDKEFIQQLRATETLDEYLVLVSTLKRIPLFNGEEITGHTYVNRAQDILQGNDILSPSDFNLLSVKGAPHFFLDLLALTRQEQRELVKAVTKPGVLRSSKQPGHAGRLRVTPQLVPAQEVTGDKENNPSRKGSVLRSLKKFAGRLIKKPVNYAIETVSKYGRYTEDEYRKTMEARIARKGGNQTKSNEIISSLYPNTGKNPENVTTPEAIRAKLGTVRKTTENQRAVFEQENIQNPEKLGFFKLLQSGAEFLDKKVSRKYRTFASLGLCAATAVATPSAPFLMTALGMATVATHALTSTATYLKLKKALDTQHDKWQEKLKEEGKELSASTKMLHNTGVLALSVGAGTVAGSLVEYIGSSSMYEEALTYVKQFIDDNNPFSEVKRLLAEQRNLIEPHVSQLQTEATVPIESIIKIEDYTVKQGDNLWSILRKNLTSNSEDFANLSSSLQDAKISEYLKHVAKNPASFGISSGNINQLAIGDTISLQKIIDTN
jgi:hypothetical protein